MNENIGFKSSNLISIRDSRGVLQLSVAKENLLYIESADNYICIWYQKNDILKKQLMRITMKEISDQLADTNIVVNADNAAVMDLTNMPEEVHGVFYDITKVEEITPPSIMFNQDFGMVETIIDNPQDVLIDRGFVSMYELHYKMGEINTLEDMENYQNNYFGL